MLPVITQGKTKDLPFQAEEAKHKRGQGSALPFCW